MRPLLRDAIEICPVGETVLSSDIEHWSFYCDGRKRLDFMRRFEAAVHPERCLIFLTMATRVEKSALALAHLGLPVEAIHSGIDKETRRVALERFTKGDVNYLLTSDLGARGLDIAGISHVISLDLPDEPTIYTHRAGRTARAERAAAERAGTFFFFKGAFAGFRTATFGFTAGLAAGRAGGRSS